MAADERVTAALNDLTIAVYYRMNRDGFKKDQLLRAALAEAIFALGEAQGSPWRPPGDVIQMATEKR